MVEGAPCRCGSLVEPNSHDSLVHHQWQNGPMAHEHPAENHQTGHQHSPDHGVKGMMRYLRFARAMWRSEINEAVITRLAPRAGERVMDIGAGAGAGTIVAVQSGASVVAVEPMGYMRFVLELRRRFMPGRARLAIVDGTAEATGVEGNSIHAAWAVNTMHHWSDLSSGIAEIARVLVPGGRVILVDEDFEDPTHPEFARFGAKRRKEHAHSFARVDPQAVADELTSAGLNVRFAGDDRIADRPCLVVEAEHDRPEP